MAINMMCMNDKCKYYYEDNCIRNINEERIEIDENGKCETFEEGISEWCTTLSKFKKGDIVYIHGNNRYRGLVAEVIEYNYRTKLYTLDTKVNEIYVSEEFLKLNKSNA
ncbi:hypothetical protein [Clostridium culturomicium]|uniref:hypothetical protein n=1 Tax=Clostridium culturomicium TaxID=1499683 RepID=UPI003857583B